MKIKRLSMMIVHSELLFLLIQFYTHEVHKEERRVLLANNNKKKMKSWCSIILGKTEFKEISRNKEEDKIMIKKSNPPRRYNIINVCH